MTSSPTNQPQSFAAARWNWWGPVAIALMLVVFAMDVFTPRGVANWQFYVGVVLLTLLSRGRWAAYAAASGCTCLLVFGWILSDESFALPLWMSMLNRTLAAGTLWLVAWGGWRVRRESFLRNDNSRLLDEMSVRKVAEDRVREQASLLDITYDAIWVLDLSGRVTFWNRGSERVYGWTAAEALGREVAGLVGSGGVAPNESLLVAGEWSGEATHVTRDGRGILTDARWTLVRDAAGRPRAVLVVSSDVTQRRHLEAQLLRTQRLDSIGALAGGIAHDFNSLLTPLLFAVRQLREDRSVEERGRLLDTMQAGAERGAALVRKLLSFAGGGDNPRVPTAVGSAVAEVRELIGHALPEAVHFEVDVAPDLPSVMADRTQFCQVLMNLCVNALDAMPESGTLSVTAEPVAVAAGGDRLAPGVAAGEFVRLRLTDTGVGIPDGIRDRIFDPFFTTKCGGRGNGLGLSTVLGIVRGHGGWVTVASELGKGTTIEVLWPVAATSASLVAVPTRDARHGNEELVLVADDEWLIPTATTMPLESSGDRAIAAKGGSVGVDAFRHHSG